MPEETIRARARGGLEALAPDLPAPARAGEIADWLLGQQSEQHAARTRELLLSDPAAQQWAATVAKPLRKVPAARTSRRCRRQVARERQAGSRVEPRAADAAAAAPSAPAAPRGSAARC